MAVRRDPVPEAETVLLCQVFLARQTAARSLAGRLPGEHAVKHAIGRAVVARRPAWRHTKLVIDFLVCALLDA